jgi:transcriptional regulator with XRE-family HTH domain
MDAKDISSFGHAIASARRGLEISQKQLAAKILKEDGQPITPQYLNDIEHDRRSPASDHMVRQFAKVLRIDPDILYWLARRVPDDITRAKVTPQQIQSGFLAFRQALKGHK